MTTTMTLEATRTRIESLFEAWNAHDIDGMLSLCTEDVIWEDPVLPATAVGREVAIESLRAQLDLFPDLRFPKEEVELYRSFDHHHAAARWHMTATMRGMEPVRIGSEGTTAPIPGMTAFEFRDGLISRVTVFYDILFLSEQLGLVSPLPALRHRLWTLTRALGADTLRLGRRLMP